MLIIDIPSKIDVDNSVDNSRSYPHFPLKDVENDLYTVYQQVFNRPLWITNVAVP